MVIILLCGCHYLTPEEREQLAIKKCKKQNGKVIINYCRGSEEICSVSCEVGK